jgi:hypothetical protein
MRRLHVDEAPELGGDLGIVRIGAYPPSRCPGAIARTDGLERYGTAKRHLGICVLGIGGTIGNGMASGAESLVSLELRANGKPVWVQPPSSAAAAVVASSARTIARRGPAGEPWA